MARNTPAVRITQVSQPLDGVGTALAIRNRESSVVDVVESALNRIERLDGELGSFTVTFPDAAMAAASEADRTLSDWGDYLPPLFGVPVSIKDHIWLAGAPSTNGSAALRDFVAPEDCVAVARLRQAGAIIVGKTNNPEFCYRGITDNAVYGLTRNPWDLTRTPGGSSGGAGASVAAGLTALSLGTDGGGSIRIPASFCGVVGHKPTFGLVPKEPGFKGWKTLSVHGPITRSVRDAAAMLSAMAGAAAADDMSYPVALPGLLNDPPADLRGARIAFSEDLGGLAVDPDVRAVFQKSLQILEELGASLYDAHPATAYPIELWNTIALTEGYASEGPLLATWRDQMYTGSAELIESGRDIRGWRYVDALHEKARYTRVWTEFFERYDLLVTPTMQLTAFETGVLSPLEIDGRPVDPFFDDWCAIALPANLTGMPATSVPAGFGANGMPVGVQFMGPRFADVRTLAAAGAFEHAVPWTTFVPPFGR
jgi:Asp-tRNA(Asn)/Glu-tRNA(Gln) amidotransferase A subunit family amidase